MAHVQELSPLAWICRIVLGLIGLSIMGGLLQSEMLKRRSSSTHFLNNYLRFTSVSCFWCGPTSSLLLILSVVPGFCMIRMIGGALMFSIQFWSLSFYQLSRLYYCFSNQQLHGKNGYPMCVFFAIITIAMVTYTGTIMLHIVVDTLPAKCGFTDELSFFYEYRERAILFNGDSFRDDWMNQIWVLWSFVLTVMAYGTDLVILLLYLFKIWNIGKIHKAKGDGVWDNVLFILHRIVIITVFYNISGFLILFFSTTLGLVQFAEYSAVNAVVDELRTVGLIVSATAIYSFSIYLMMDHNTNIYIDFLHFLKRFRLKYCCFCCYHKMVDHQLEQLGPPKKLEAQMSAASSSGDNLGIESTMFLNLSVNVVYTSDASPNELSCETVTQIVSPS